MSDKVRVRMVPKSRDAASFTVDLARMTPATAKSLRPDRSRAESAMRHAFSVGIDAEITQKNRVDGLVPVEQMSTVFGAEMIEKERESREYGDRGIGPKEYLSSKTELVVPDSMSDAIAFAYIPTPPEFVAATPVAPKASVYHLSLHEVLNALEGGHCHRRGWTGRNIRVAMTDSGFAAHPYFELNGYNIVRVASPSTSNPMIDDSGHGTGESANVLILAPDAQLIGVKHDDYSALALETALEQNPHVITNSWGWDVDRFTMGDIQNADPNFFNELRDLENIINDAIDDGVTVIFAAGNGHRMFPASMPAVVSVGGTTVHKDGALEASTYASSFRSVLYPGRAVPDFCAVVGEYNSTGAMKGHIMLPVPSGSDLEGENLPSSKSNRGWGIFSGTSAATPQVAGLVALMLSANPNLTPGQIRSVLTSTTTDVTQGQTGLGDAADTGHDFATGAGFVNARRACELSANLT